jgi:hypothetical protein
MELEYIHKVLIRQGRRLRLIPANARHDSVHELEVKDTDMADTTPDAELPNWSQWTGAEMLAWTRAFRSDKQARVCLCRHLMAARNSTYLEDVYSRTGAASATIPRQALLLNLSTERLDEQLAAEEQEGFVAR